MVGPVLFALAIGAAQAAKVNHRPMTYLALGDSYTIGESVTDEERWPVQLVEALNGKGFQFAKPRIIARTGWTASELVAGIEESKEHGSYDLVSLLVGVNDQYRGLSVEAYREEFASLVSRAIAFARGLPSRVIVLSIPDWGVTAFARGRDGNKIAKEIDEFNHAAGAETMRRGVHFVDITPISRKAITDNSLIASDGLHPSAKMYRLWVRLMLPKVEHMLGANSLPKKTEVTG